MSTAPASDLTFSQTAPEDDRDFFFPRACETTFAAIATMRSGRSARVKSPYGARVGKGSCEARVAPLHDASSVATSHERRGGVPMLGTPPRCRCEVTTT